VYDGARKGGGVLTRQQEPGLGVSLEGSQFWAGAFEIAPDAINHGYLWLLPRQDAGFILHGLLVRPVQVSFLREVVMGPTLSLLHCGGGGGRIIPRRFLSLVFFFALAKFLPLTLGHPACRWLVG